MPLRVQALDLFLRQAKLGVDFVDQGRKTSNIGQKIQAGNWHGRDRRRHRGALIDQCQTTQARGLDFRATDGHAVFRNSHIFASKQHNLTLFVIQISFEIQCTPMT